MSSSNCNRHWFDECDYTCPYYNGHDLDFYLNLHMFGDFQDSITLTQKEIRDLVTKHWSKLNKETQDEWNNFTINTRSGRRK